MPETRPVELVCLWCNARAPFTPERARLWVALHAACNRKVRARVVPREKEK